MTQINLAARIALIVCGSACAVAHADTVVDWNFGSLPITSPDNNPGATGGTQQSSSASTATALGMTNTYVESTGNNVSTNFDDITNDTDSTIGSGDVWRIRGAGSAKNAGNGWSTNAPQYSQGAQFTTTTAGYNNIVLSFNWASTAQGILNMQVQYNTNVNNASGWTNVGPLQYATIANSAVGGTFQTDTINFGALGITSVNNDASFGVRLVSAYDPSLAGGTEYASATTTGGLTEYNNNSGNWRFADVQIDGAAVAPVPLPAAAWLLVSGVGGLGVFARKRKAA